MTTDDERILETGQYYSRTYAKSITEPLVTYALMMV